LRDTTRERLLICSAEVAAGGCKLAVHLVGDIALDLGKLRGERRIVTDHAAVGIGRELALIVDEVTLHVRRLRIGAAAEQRLRITADLARIGIALCGIALQRVERAGFRRRQPRVVQVAADLAENSLQHRLRRRPGRALGLLGLRGRGLSAHLWVLVQC
jgi:hypothetical protein